MTILVETIHALIAARSVAVTSDTILSPLRQAGGVLGAADCSHNVTAFIGCGKGKCN